jgi:hypothetical protein
MSSSIIPGLGGYVCIRDNHRLAYCAEHAIESLLPVCEEVVVADGDSTDGTLQTLQRMADRDKRIKIIRYPWTNPRGVGHKAWVEWLNFARRHLTTKFQITLDGDETLQNSDECHTAIREACADPNPARRFRRNNYWKSPEFVIPTGHCCADRVVRLGLASMEMPSDQPVAPGEYPIVDAAKDDDRLLIHHLGFLRPKEQFYRKAEAVLGIWFGSKDDRLTRGEAEGKQLWETESGAAYNHILVKHKDTLPDDVQRLLTKWGHFTEKYVPIITTPPDPHIEITEERAEKEPLGILHHGDFGDILMMLPICKAIGNVNLFHQDRHSICKRILERLHVIAPLLEAQPYINVAKPHEGEPVHWLAGDFRVHHELTRSLAWAHLMHYLGSHSLPKVLPDFREPWLTAQPDPRATGKIIINRTSRYNNRFFRWGDILKHYNTSLLFIGTREEHTAFCNTFGPVTYQPTADLLEAARLIAGSALFIGNQSACFAIAEGLKHPRLLEVCLYQPDVIVQASQEGLYLSADGSVNLPAVGQHRPLLLTSAITTVDYLKNPMMQPRTGWYVGQTWAPTYWALKKMLRKGKPGMDDNDAHRIAYDALAEREPEYFDNSQQRAELNLFHEAVGNAL